MRKIVSSADFLALALRDSDSIVLCVLFICSFHLSCVVCGSIQGPWLGGESLLVKSPSRFPDVGLVVGQRVSQCLFCCHPSVNRIPRLPHLLLLSVFQLVKPSSASRQEEEVGGKRHVPNSPGGSLPNAWRGAAAVWIAACRKRHFANSDLCKNNWA